MQFGDRNLCGDRVRLNVSQLVKHNGLADGAQYAITLDRELEIYLEVSNSVLSVTSDQDGSGTFSNTALRQEIPIEWSPCRYGGQRPWFRCPGSPRDGGCGRRCALLFWHKGFFACRSCHGLRYASQYERRDLLALRRAKQIHRQLGGDGYLLGPVPPRPRYMHRSTYERLLERIQRPLAMIAR